MKIGNVTIKGCAALAPMAGVADKAMRQICISHGAAFCVGELTSSKGVSMGDAKSKTLLCCSNGERPMASQIFGGCPETMSQAAKIAESFTPDFIDINMGCPAPKVIKSGGGSALLKDPVLAGKIIEAVVKCTSLPVTVKIRAGWDKNSINAVEMAHIAESSGASAITVHARTREQMYAPSADWNIITDVKKAVKIPVIGNGDIISAQSAAKMLEKTGCDAVMVGRAAMGKPWIFTQINTYLNEGRIIPEPPLSYKMATLIKQVELMHEYKDSHNAILESRKHAAFYMHGLNGASELRKKCSAISSLNDLTEIVKTAMELNNEN